MDMTLPPGELAAICIWSGRTAAGVGATGLMASCGLGATLDVLLVVDVAAEDVEVAVLGLGESWDDMGEAGDIGVLLLLL